jgi:hypothetical protein
MSGPNKPDAAEQEEYDGSDPELGPNGLVTVATLR